jgi:hypothetical protein
VSPRKNIACRIPEVCPEKTVGSAINQYEIKQTCATLPNKHDYYIKYCPLSYRFSNKFENWMFPSTGVRTERFLLSQTC